MGAGTRHVELFENLKGWVPRIIASNRMHSSQDRVPSEWPFKLVSVPKYKRNGINRIAGFVVYSIKAAVEALRMPKLDLVYASTPHLLTPFAGLAAARIRRVPLVLEVRDLWPDSIASAGIIDQNSFIYKVLSHAERFISQAADAIVVVTPGWEDHYANLGVDLEKIHVIPNGADYVPAQENNEHQQTRTFRAVYAGTHGPANAIDRIIDAAATLPHIDFLLIGSGSKKASAREKVKRLGLRNVEFRDRVSKDELYEVLSSCDVGIHTVEPLEVLNLGMSPNKMFDYLAAGIPVVSNARVPLRYVMADDQCGRLGGPDELAECLESVRTAGSAERERWVDNGRTLLQERFSRRSSISRLNGLLDEVHRAALSGRHEQRDYGIESRRGGEG